MSEINIYKENKCLLSHAHVFPGQDLLVTVRSNVSAVYVGNSYTQLSSSTKYVGITYILAQRNWHVHVVTTYVDGGQGIQGVD